MDTLTPGEPVRLVIWDLDDTLWRGTLDDLAVIEHIESHYEIVRELNRRGIMNSVCSKNNYSTAQAALEAVGIWDEFVFPSIDWTSKGARLVELIAAMQLRPESVLFIDDNERNLAEAREMIAGIQVAEPTIISGLLEDIRLRGSNDSGLTRLAHYKALYKRYQGRAAASGNNIAFLRESEIKITLDYDIEANIDRAIELINRTNQLNFTKLRLPEDVEAAKNDLRELISAHNVKAALIKVNDCYGDHGYCGIYVVQGSEVTKILIHFCFSCRIMGMGIEQKVFEFIGRPELNVVGETVSDVTTPMDIDWITIGEARDEGEAKSLLPLLGEVRLRGGCELSSVGHYFNLCARSLTYETNYARKHLFFMRDCTTNLLSPYRDGKDVDVACRLDTEPWEYETQLFNPIESDGVLIISMWGDVVAAHYRHKDDGVVVANSLRNMWENGIEISAEEVDEKFLCGLFSEDYREETLNYISKLRAHFDFAGRLNLLDLNANYHEIFRRIPTNVPAFFLLPSRYWMSASRKMTKFPLSIGYNLELRKISADYKNVELVNIDDFIEGDHERHEGFRHFDRVVYYRIYKHITKRCSDRPAQGGV